MGNSIISKNNVHILMKNTSLPKNANHHLSLQQLIIVFAGGGSCLDDDENTLSVKHSKGNKMS